MGKASERFSFQSLLKTRVESWVVLLLVFIFFFGWCWHGKLLQGGKWGNEDEEAVVRVVQTMRRKEGGIGAQMLTETKIGILETRAKDLSWQRNRRAM